MARVPLAPLGPECTFGCALAALLDCPRSPPGSLALPPPSALPVSRLFDPLAPSVTPLSVQLQVQPPQGLPLSLEVRASHGSGQGENVTDASGQALPAVEPGQEAQVCTWAPQWLVAAAWGASCISSH